MGIVIAALGLWMVLISRTPFRKLVVGGTAILATVGVGLLIDWWGYGAFGVTPWNYLQSNLLEGRAATFGTEPWYYYFLGVPLQPMGILLLGAGVLFCISRPRNLLTWTAGLFVLVHVVLAHKELRFLTPVTHLALAMFVFLIPRSWYSAGDRDNPFLGHARWVRLAFYVFAAINLLALVGGSLRVPRIEVAIHKFIYREYPEHFEFYSLGPSPFLYGTPELRMEFYGPQRIVHRKLETMSDLATILPHTPQVIWYHAGERVPTTPAWPAFHHHCTMIYQSFGPWMQKINSLTGQWRWKSPSSLYRCSQQLE
jgi:phosphatidylinositol glycan class B